MRITASSHEKGINDVNQSINSNNQDKGIHTSYLEKMSKHKQDSGPYSKYKEKLEKSPQLSTRKMYFDIKKELDVTRIE